MKIPYLSVALLSLSSTVAAVSGPNLTPRADPLTKRQYIDQSTKSIKIMMNGVNKEKGIFDDYWWQSGCLLSTTLDYAVQTRDTPGGGGLKYIDVGPTVRDMLYKAGELSVSTKERRSTDDDVPQKMNAILKRVSRILTTRADPRKNFINEFYDDEGWWGLALIAAYDYLGGKSNADAKVFLSAAVKIFEDMAGGTGKCSKNGGGILWKKNEGYFSSISNELLLSVSAHLARRLPDDKRFLAQAEAQWRWLQDTGVFYANGTIGDGVGPSCKNRNAPIYTYNQGVILGGLVELYKVTKSDCYLKHATKIAKGALAHFAGHQDNVIRELKCGVKPCTGDGQMFKGIFARNLGLLYEVEPLPEIRKAIIASAESLVRRDRSPKGNRYSDRWHGPWNVKSWSYATQGGATDCFLAAYRILRKDS